MKNVRVRNREQGNGSTGIAAYLLFLSLLMAGFFWVVDYIYLTKESKVQARWEAHLVRIRAGVNLIDRGPGEYQVSCRPGFTSRCE